MKKKRVFLFVVVAVISLAVLASIAGADLYRANVRAKVRRSAGDLLVLDYACQSHGISAFPIPMIPDWAFDSPELKKLYHINPKITPEFVQEYESMDHSGPQFLKLTDPRSEFGSIVELQCRIFNWRGLVKPVNHLAIAEFTLRRKNEIRAHPHNLRQQAADRNMSFEDYTKWLEKEIPIPTDPFAKGGPKAIYRYGLVPLEGATMTVNYEAWIIAGNGPDGDADVDVTRFRGHLPGQPLNADPTWGQGVPIEDLTYDPSNGTFSNGDIIVIHPPSSRDPNYGAFRYRYGL